MAAVPDGRLTAIVGAAGSGKSRVLVERIARIVETAPTAEPPKVLVTAFNKDVIGMLADWLIERLGPRVEGAPGRAADGVLKLKVTTQYGAGGLVQFMNRDKLPTRIYRVQDSSSRGSWEQSLKTWSREWAKTHEKPRTPLDEFGASWLEAELERVIYGLDVKSQAEYVAVERQGRRVALQPSKRPDVWSFLMDEGSPSHFVRRRMKAYERYRSEIADGKQLNLQVKWTHVIVDEGHDFTRTDLELLARTPAAAPRLCIGVDETQAMHLGGCYSTPAIPGTTWKRERLVGTYRMPPAVADAVRPLARSIASSRSNADLSDMAEPERRKAAVAGPRPIVIDGNGPVDDLRAALTLYWEDGTELSLIQGGTPSRPDHDPLIHAALREIGTPFSWESMSKIKGLERSMVVFSSAVRAPGDEATDEWVYTALTRSSRLLLLILYGSGPSDVKQALAHLDPEHLMFWTQGAQDKFEAYRDVFGDEEVVGA